MERYQDLIQDTADLIEREYVTNGSECDAMDIAYDYVLSVVLNTRKAMSIIWYACEQLGMN